ncbi:DUF2231 domain-containing protein [Propionibacteriaceae bacterium G1746]|uniref:DUF2231 domain-containing protein n=1 Tax=Aestuariimicrobium sp. G57 TaxID=3418485 RepID=UPI003C1AD273
MDIFGLPLHPLVVHAVVVIVPLAALGALLLVAVPRLRAAYGWLTVAFAVVGAISAVVARVSGTALAADLHLTTSSLIARHMALGTWTPLPAGVLAIAVAGLVWSAGRPPDKRNKTLVGVFAAITVVAAIASLVMVGLTGHAGASAVWGS